MAASFVHCGDIHLGFNQYNSEERFLDFHRSFSHIVDYAIEKDVDYFLVTGDFFNKRTVNPKTLSQAMGQLKRLKDKAILVLAIEGNHDKAPYGEGESWMQFLHQQGYLRLLNPSFHEGCLALNPHQGGMALFPGIRFVGMGYQGSMTARRIQELNRQLEPREGVTVLMLHSAVDMLMHLGGIKYTDLTPLKDRVDYVAMGHVHHRYQVEEWVFNPGSPESWDLGEGGKEKGFYHVILEKEGKKVSHIPSLRRPVHSLSLNVTGCKEVDQVYQLCRREAKGLDVEKGSRPMVRLILTGCTPFSPLAIDTGMLEEKIRSVLDCLMTEVVNNTVMEGDGETLADNPAHMNREDLEREVLHQLFLSRGDQNPWVHELVELTRNVKELIHQEAEDSSIALLIEGLANKMVEREGEKVKEEAAAAREPSAEGGDIP